MNNTKLIVIGGFLAAGKTTSILSIAKHLLKKNYKIGIVTNDQGSQLVDTAFLASNGLPVLEVEGGCFCCNFDEFSNKLNQLSAEQKPDIILAEPVGSCTDLIATIYKPMQKELTHNFELRPLSVVVDPKRLRRLMFEADSPFPNEINYLFQKQLEEADIIVLNKIDSLNDHEIMNMERFLKERFKGAEVVKVSAREDINIETWVDKILGDVSVGQRTLDIDYKTYARAEAYLGWLNFRTSLKAKMPVDWNCFLKELIENTRCILKNKKSEIAHLKAYCISQDDWAKVSLISVYEDMDFSRNMEKPSDEVQLIINARVNMDPQNLEAVIMDALNKYKASMNLEMYNSQLECFSPKEPKPKYRIAG